MTGQIFGKWERREFQILRDTSDGNFYLKYNKVGKDKFEVLGDGRSLSLAGLVQVENGDPNHIKEAIDDFSTGQISVPFRIILDDKTVLDVVVQQPEAFLLALKIAVDKKNTSITNLMIENQYDDNPLNFNLKSTSSEKLAVSKQNIRIATLLNLVFCNQLASNYVIRERTTLCGMIEPFYCQFRTYHTPCSPICRIETTWCCFDFRGQIPWDQRNYAVDDVRCCGVAFVSPSSK